MAATNSSRLRHSKSIIIENDNMMMILMLSIELNHPINSWQIYEFVLKSDFDESAFNNTGNHDLNCLVIYFLSFCIYYWGASLMYKARI